MFIKQQGYIRNSQVNFHQKHIMPDITLDPKTTRVHYRYGKAFVYLYGKPYYLTFRPQACIDRPWLKIKDVAISIDDAKRLPWKTASSNARQVVRGLDKKKPYCLKLQFPEKYEGRHFIFLDRGFPKKPRQSARDRAMESMSRETKLAQEDEDQCVICLSNVYAAKFAPCGHSRVCCACAFELVQTTKKCPLCREKISFFTRV
jgi:hypothetical protein